MADDEVEREFAPILLEAQLMARGRNEDLNQGHIFSVIIAKVIMDAPPNATKDWIKQRANALVRRYGFDPDRPWLGRWQTEDDL
jgi:hypothetical protein